MDEPSGVTQEEGHRIFFFFLHYVIAGASSKLLILLVETVTQFARTNIISSTVEPAFYVRYIILYIFLPSTDGAVRGMFLSSHSWRLDFFRFYIFRYKIWTNHPGSHKRKATGFIYLLFTVYNSRCLVKSINITSRNSNAILRVPILLVVQLNMHCMCAI